MTASRRADTAIQYLPVDYQLSQVDILCGRGKACANLPGNRRFVEILRSNLPQYTAASSRSEKSVVVADVIRQIVEIGAKFVKKDVKTCRLFQISTKDIHHKTGHAMRDLLKKDNSTSSYDGSTSNITTRRKYHVNHEKIGSNQSNTVWKNDAVAWANMYAYSTFAPLAIPNHFLLSKHLQQTCFGELETTRPPNSSIVTSTSTEFVETFDKQIFESNAEISTDVFENMSDNLADNIPATSSFEAQLHMLQSPKACTLPCANNESIHPRQVSYTMDELIEKEAEAFDNTIWHKL